MKRQYMQDQQMDQHNLAFHPYDIMLFLTLTGITMLFLALTGAYIYTRVQSQYLIPIKVPYLFLLNTLVLLASSYTMMLAKKAYLLDNTEAYQRNILTTLLLTILFVLMQLLAWKLLYSNNINIAHSNLASYLYAMSILHFAHVLAGLPFLVMFYRTAILKMKEPVSVLIYFSDPLKKLKLNLLTFYWHFLDILWVYLVLFLWANQYIK